MALLPCCCCACRLCGGRGIARVAALCLLVLCGCGGRAARWLCLLCQRREDHREAPHGGSELYPLGCATHWQPALAAGEHDGWGPRALRRRRCAATSGGGGGGTGKGWRGGPAARDGGRAFRNSSGEEHSHDEVPEAPEEHHGRWRRRRWRRTFDCQRNARLC
jgi:hypothetical protein